LAPKSNPYGTGDKSRPSLEADMEALNPFICNDFRQKFDLSIIEI